MEIIQGYKRKFIGDPLDHDLIEASEKLPGILGLMAGLVNAFHFDGPHEYGEQHEHTLVRAVKTPFEVAISVRDALRHSNKQT